MASIQGWIFDRDAVVEYLAREREELKAKFQAWEKASDSLKKRDSEEKSRSSQLDAWNESEKNVISSKKRSISEVEGSKPNSFWIAANPSPAQDSGNKGSLGERPDTTPLCPMSGDKLRFKDLVPVNFEMTSDGDHEKGMYCCAITKRPITHQQALLVKPSGVVVLESAFKQSLDRHDARCPVTGAQLIKSDIIRLQVGGTSYSAHNKVEVKVHKYV